MAFRPPHWEWNPGLLGIYPIATLNGDAPQLTLSTGL